MTNEEVYDIKWLQQLASEYLSKHSIGTAFEKVGKVILEKLGFTNVRKPLTGGYDFHAEKNGKTYAIEVKGSASGEDIVIRWSGLRKLWKSGLEEITGHPLLLFINAEGEWCMYEFFDGIMG